MEKDRIHSASLGLGKEAELFGKWAKKNGGFTQLKYDSWREGTQYWLPAYIPDKGNIQRLLIDELVKSNMYKSYELLELKTFLLPVAEVGDLIIPLSKKYATEEYVDLLNPNKGKGYDIRSNFEWQNADEQKLQQYSSIIEPFDQPFTELQEEVHFRGGDSIALIDESINVFFLPVSIFSFKFNYQTYNWLYIADGRIKLKVETLYNDLEAYNYINISSHSRTDDIKMNIDHIFTMNEKSGPGSIGCIIPIILVAVGVGIISLIWSSLKGLVLFICIVGIALVLYFVNKALNEAAARAAYRNREKKKQNIIETRKAKLRERGKMGK